MRDRGQQATRDEQIACSRPVVHEQANSRSGDYQNKDDLKWAHRLTTSFARDSLPPEVILMKRVCFDLEVKREPFLALPGPSPALNDVA